jgi:hypothetical protein
LHLFAFRVPSTSTHPRLPVPNRTSSRDAYWMPIRHYEQEGGPLSGPVWLDAKPASANRMGWVRSPNWQTLASHG